MPSIRRRAPLAIASLALLTGACSAFDPKVGPLVDAAPASLPACSGDDDADAGRDSGESYPGGNDNDTPVDSGACTPVHDAGSS
jgi:hypothetical protein